MPAPRWLARVNRVATNRLANQVAPWAPGLAVVVHRGRRSGRTFRTPVNVFRREGGFVIPLTYGRESDWVQNVLAAGGCELVTRRRRYELVNPRLYRDDSAEEMPAFVRFLLRRVVKVPDFLALEPTAAAEPGSTGISRG
ncbi:MAG: nitroreductase family deazaflavin-dependent oxidoreductase [Actinomycetota bacterium]